ncbi:MAG: helix-turn-helix transcriptional regulator [Candidatus Thiodiazotropha taylori]|nr:helix-turn-helix transcriptional regulator [Candidatus Thiodiazotropha taylori]
MTTIKLDSLMEWRLLPVMAERRIRRATDLKRLLEDEGIEISSSQLSRLVSSTPQRLSMELLGGLMRVLDCEASDLIRRVDRESNTTPTPKPTVKKKKAIIRQRKPASQKTEEAAESLTGPKVAPFPIPKREK